MIYIKSDDLTVRTMAGSNGGPPPRRVRRCHVSITHAATSRWTTPVRLSTASATANQITADVRFKDREVILEFGYSVSN